MKLSDTSVIIDGTIHTLKSLRGKRAVFIPTGETMEIQKAVSKDRVEVKFVYTNCYGNIQLSAQYRVSAIQLTFQLQLG